MAVWNFAEVTWVFRYSEVPESDLEILFWNFACVENVQSLKSLEVRVEFSI